MPKIQAQPVQDQPYRLSVPLGFEQVLDQAYQSVERARPLLNRRLNQAARHDLITKSDAKAIRSLLMTREGFASLLPFINSSGLQQCSVVAPSVALFDDFKSTPREVNSLIVNCLVFSLIEAYALKTSPPMPNLWEEGGKTYGNPKLNTI